ncbi:hypothetical protein K504DRAFT_268959 [Pleomassaria siparia CBS 279.74]|uniref:Uncharacterized protein n=1 Tax=Pleomassaria siparia CBS 279.74 TaxID=1314801 RepID=A0A6G1K9A7_9PLEO|nr:hypothetical protein K504DRAFT_268959 [Pleomassaria siparia CBS 279.74]
MSLVGSRRSRAKLYQAKPLLCGEGLGCTMYYLLYVHICMYMYVYVEIDTGRRITSKSSSHYPTIGPPSTHMSEKWGTPSSFMCEGRHRPHSVSVEKEEKRRKDILLYVAKVGRRQVTFFSVLFWHWHWHHVHENK